MKSILSWLVLFFLVINNSGTIIAKTLVNINKSGPEQISRLPLKWKTRVGFTTYRTTLHYIDGLLVVPSNGKSRQSINDSLDGVHILNARSGADVKKLVIGDYGDRDVNGVAISATKIVFGDDAGNVAAFNWKYEPLWLYEGTADFESAPILTYINNDPVLDVVIADEAGNLVALNGLNGEKIWSFIPAINPGLLYPTERSFMAAGSAIDINKDNKRDILIGNRNGIFYAFNGKDGKILWKTQTQTPSGIFSPTYATKKSIYFAETYGTIFKVSHKGRILQRINVAPNTGPHIVAMPQINSQGIVLQGTTFDDQASGYHQIIPYKNSKYEPIGKVSSTPLLVDFDGVEGQEFVFVTESGWLMVINQQGDVIGQYELLTGAEATPYIGDVDGDSRLELIIALNDQYLYCYDLLSQGEVSWGQFRANPYNTGILNDTIKEDGFMPNAPFKPNLFKEKASYNSFDYDTWYSKKVDKYLISPLGIGDALLGLTLGQLRQRLQNKARFKPVVLENGLKAMAVILDNQVQYYLIFLQSQTITNASLIKMVVTNNPKYYTKSGVNSGAYIDKVSSFLGTPTLSYNSSYPLEEKIRFASQPRWVLFTSYSEQKAGIYRENKKVNMTKAFKFGAKIQFIGVR